MNGGNLIVRVKRRRDDVPVDSLCIVEDDAPRTKKSVSDSSLLHSLGALSTSDSATGGGGQRTGGRSIVLRRVKTLSSVAGSQTGAVVSMANAGKRSHSEIDSPPVGSTAAGSDSFSGTGLHSESLWVTEGRDTFQSPSDGCAYVVVDLSQVQTHGQRPGGRQAERAMTGGQGQLPRSPVVSPPARQLEKAIDAAWQLGDFTDMSFALQQGADVNHQRSPVPGGPASGAASAGGGLNVSPPPPCPLQGGETALMAAARKCNVRMVNRLLSLGANALLTDCRGMSAMDHLRHEQARLDAAGGVEAGAGGHIGASGLSYAYAAAAQEVAVKLHAAALQSHRAGRNPHAASPSTPSSRPEGQGGVAGMEGEDGGEGEGEGEFVVDVFCAFAASADPSAARDQPVPLPSTGQAEGLQPQQQQQQQATHQFSLPPPVVPVAGLRIGNDGEVALALAYDSDWSDLGDDEDPDSNDERHPGNDYPDEEEEDDDEEDGNGNGNGAGGGEGDSDSEMARHRGIGRADLEDEDEEYHNGVRMAGGGTKGKAGGRSGGKDKGRQPRAGMSLGDGSSDDEEDEDEEDDDDEEEEECAGLSLGRFERESTGRVVRPGLQGGDAFAPGRLTGPELRRLWGEEDKEDGDEDEGEGEGEGEGGEVRGALNPTLSPANRLRALYGGGHGFSHSQQHPQSLQHRERLRGMRQASGLVFASQPREFDAAGLAKFGAELSDDDEIDAMAVPDGRAVGIGVGVGAGVGGWAGAGGWGDDRPPRDTVAFDPLLDVEQEDMDET